MSNNTSYRWLARRAECACGSVVLDYLLCAMCGFSGLCAEKPHIFKRKVPLCRRRKAACPPQRGLRNSCQYSLRCGNRGVARGAPPRNSIKKRPPERQIQNTLQLRTYVLYLTITRSHIQHSLDRTSSTSRVDPARSTPRRK